jgi:hypothetical protein
MFNLKGFKGSSVAESHELMAVSGFKIRRLGRFKEWRVDVSYQPVAFLDGAKASLRAPHSRE